MPEYEFFCTACKETFSTTLTLVEYEKGKIVCENVAAGNSISA
jgi:hypothetical protein